MHRLTSVALLCLLATHPVRAQDQLLHWHEVAPIPDALGLAGPIVGVHDEIVLCGGGANFDQPVWDNDKKWRQGLYALDLHAPNSWRQLPDLPQAIAYSACASTPFGIIVVGGNDANRVLADVWLLTPKRQGTDIFVARLQLASLPVPLVYAQAAWLQDRIVVSTGQTDHSLVTATAQAWELPMPDATSLHSQRWHAIEACPGGPRAFALVTAVSKSAKQLLLVGGRRQGADRVEFLSDAWLYDSERGEWSRRASLPVPVTAGAAGPVAKDKIAIISGDDGSLFTQTDQLKDQHPGFKKRTWIYDGAKDQWQPAGPSPANQVTTTAVLLADDRLMLISGEIRPRVRTNRVWEISYRR